MPPKTILAKFQFLTPKNPAIENSPKNPSIIPETWNSEYPPPHPRAPLVLLNEIFSYLLHIFTRSILCVGKCTKLGKDLNTEFSSTGHIVPFKGMQHDA